MSPTIRKQSRWSPRKEAAIFAALGDETRLALLHRLSAGPPMSIARLTEATTLTRQAITKHLRVLQSTGLVRNVRQGRERLFEFEPKPLGAALASLNRISKQWDDALGRLKMFVEKQ